MSFGDYRIYSSAELKRTFGLTVPTNATLFADFQVGKEPYSDLQTAIDKMTSRISLSKSDNEATRRNLLGVAEFRDEWSVRKILHSPLNPPILGDFKQPHPPELGVRGAKSFLR